MLPSIRPRLMVGVNQVIMLTLNMVIIASLIGAGGLGFDVWQALKALRIGQGAEAGIAITLVAIVLDRISQKYAMRAGRSIAMVCRHSARRYQAVDRHWCRGASGPTIVGLLGARLRPRSPIPGPLARASSGTTSSIGSTSIFMTYIDGFRRFLFHLSPESRPRVFHAVLALAWDVVIFVAALGYHLGRLRLAILAAVLVSFIAMVGLWEKAMISAYLVGVCVFLASIIGIPIGVISAGNERVHKVVQVIIDTLQTLPSFVYLIPVIMLFSVGEFSAMVAIVMYSVVPAIRYTDFGIRQVTPHLIEASRAMGCTRWQILRRVQLPLALPQIMLGVNQTLMMGLSMLVITALVGTRDLGQETLIAISKVDPGRGVTAGICVAFIAITVDRLINAWVQKRKSELGLSASQ